MSATEPRVVTSLADVERHAGHEASVEGVYEQRDVRMRRVAAQTVHAGHAAVVLADGTAVFLEPPQEEEAIRAGAEIERCEHRTVRATGLLLAANPGEGAAIDAPCLVEVGSVEPIDG